MTTTERQPYRYQLATDDLQCRADLLDAQPFEVEVDYGFWDEYEDWVHSGTFTLVIAARDRAAAEAHISEPVDSIDARYYRGLEFKTV